MPIISFVLYQSYVYVPVLYLRDIPETDWVNFVFSFVVPENVDTSPVAGLEGCYIVEACRGIYSLPVILVSKFFSTPTLSPFLALSDW